MSMSMGGREGAGRRPHALDSWLLPLGAHLLQGLALLASPTSHPAAPRFPRSTGPQVHRPTGPLSQSDGSGGAPANQISTSKPGGRGPETPILLPPAQPGPTLFLERLGSSLLPTPVARWPMPALLLLSKDKTSVLTPAGDRPPSAVHRTPYPVPRPPYTSGEESGHDV